MTRRMPPAHTSDELHADCLRVSNVNAQMPVVALAGQCDANSIPVLIMVGAPNKMVGAPNKMGQMSYDAEVK
jgi:hypothetical protein